MATNRHPSPFSPYWLFWSESLLLVITTALATFFVLKDDPIFPLAWYEIAMVAPPCIVGFGTVFFFALRNRQIAESFQMGALIVCIGEVIAIFVNTFLVNAIWRAQLPACQIQCGNGALIGAFEIFWPLFSMLPGVAAAGFASLLAWIVIRLRRGQQNQVKAENR